MRVENLLPFGAGQCMLLQMEGGAGRATVLLDCGIDLVPLCASKCLFHPTEGFGASVKFHHPDFASIDVESLDAVVISNHLNMLALPFLTEYTRCTAKVYATNAAVAIGRLMMLELVEYFGNRSRPVPFPFGLTHHGTADAQVAGALSYLYTAHDVEACVQKINGVNYHEVTDIAGVSLQAVSSGTYLGSANWIISSLSEKFVYLCDCCSALHHPTALDVMPLQKCHVCLVASPPPPLFSPQPQQQPQCYSYEQTLQEFTAIVGSTLRQGGNVLVPCYPTGVLFDLLEQLHKDVPLAHPALVVSPRANEHFAYTTICTEWLCAEKQALGFIPETPFVHTAMHACGSLLHYPTTAYQVFTSAQRNAVFATALREPCIVFAGHPSCRGGDVTHLARMWGSSPKNAVVLVEPGFCSADVLTPFEPLACQVHYCECDPRQQCPQLGSLIAAVRPDHLLAPACCVQSPSNPPWSVLANPEGPVTPFPERKADGSTATVVIPTAQARYHNADITPELGKALQTHSLGGDCVEIATASCVFETKDNRLVLHNPSLADMKLLSLTPHKHLWGSPLLSTFLNALLEVLDQSIEFLNFVV
eukprot:TRINITY_DN1888_c0_g1_i1.p1 TRINITY_DN1888_c0_g1~~TRINITY_DN1888_c0_g1_i1.p1  ORF type:complete len:590 (+),score=129.76 TRINITY_DN1888_c0_g1_i1:2-1771(+)